MKNSRTTALFAVFVALISTCFAQRNPSMAQTVARARTQDITPQKFPPVWMDWARVKRGLAFYQAHQQGITDVLATTSLVETYAAKDIAPVTVHTGKLVKGYTKRIMETGIAIQSMLMPEADKASFVQHAYGKAYELGMLHLDLSHSIKPEDLGWKASERHVISQQAFALVLYAFAWQPIESLEATKGLDPVKDASGIADWIYLWRVFGYALGVESELLPRDAANALAVVTQLRHAQYPGPGEPVASGAPLLVKGEMRMLILFAGGGAKAAGLASKRLAAALAVSPGLIEALQLGADPQASLAALVKP